MTSRAADRVDRRQLLLDAARDLFRTTPYDQVTTTEITRQAGVAYGLLAHHFGNKRGLYLATLRAAVDDLRLRRDEPPRGRTPRARLRNAVSRHVTYVRDNADAYLALVHGSLGADPDVRAIIEELQASGARLVLDGLGAPDPAPPRLRLAVAGWVGNLNALLQDWLTHRDLPESAVVDTAVTALLAVVPDLND